MLRFLGDFRTVACEEEERRGRKGGRAGRKEGAEGRVIQVMVREGKDKACGRK